MTEDYFAVMGMRLVEGRLFLPSDNGEAPPASIVNQTFVRRYLGSAPPLGQQLRFPGNDKPTTIVGVIADTRTERLREAPEPELYASFWQNGAFSKHLVVRATGDPLALAPQVRAAVRGVQATAAVEHVTTMAEIRRAVDRGADLRAAPPRRLRGRGDAAGRGRPLRRAVAVGRGADAGTGRAPGAGRAAAIR